MTLEFSSTTGSTSASRVDPESRLDSVPLRLDSLPPPSRLAVTGTGTVLPPPATIYRNSLPRPPSAVEFHNPRPMGGFQQTQPAQSSVLLQRADSIQRNLPQHTTLRPGASSRGLRGGHSTRGGRGSGSGGRGRGSSDLSGNPFALVPTVRRASASKKKEKAKQRRYLVCILPFAVRFPVNFLPSASLTLFSKATIKTLMPLPPVTNFIL
jgi:hypothetical protein